MDVEEKIEEMEWETISYRAGYMDALRLVFLFVVTATILRVIWWG